MKKKAGKTDDTDDDVIKDDEEQSKRFLEKAKELGAEKKEKPFNDALKSVTNVNEK